MYKRVVCVAKGMQMQMQGAQERNGVKKKINIKKACEVTPKLTQREMLVVTDARLLVSLLQNALAQAALVSTLQGRLIGLPSQNQRKNLRLRDRLSIPKNHTPCHLFQRGSCCVKKKKEKRKNHVALLLQNGRAA